MLFNHHVTGQVERAILQYCYIVKTWTHYEKITRFTNVLYLRRIVAL